MRRVDRAGPASRAAGAPPRGRCRSTPTTSAPTLAWLIVSQSAGPASIIGSTNGADLERAALGPGDRVELEADLAADARGGATRLEEAAEPPDEHRRQGWAARHHRRALNLLREPDADRRARMDVRPDAREALTADQRPLELGQQRRPVAQRAQRVDPVAAAGRHDRDPEVARRSPPRRRARRWPVRRAPGAPTGRSGRRSTRGTARAAVARHPRRFEGPTGAGTPSLRPRPPGIALGASRTAARSSGVAVRPSTAAPITATSSTTGTAAPAGASARRRRDGGLVGTGSTIIAMPTVRAPGVHGCRYPRTR